MTKGFLPAEEPDQPGEEDVRQMATQRGKPTLSASCLTHCNNRDGHCPDYCGENGYCLVTGLIEGGDPIHTCVFLDNKKN